MLEVALGAELSTQHAAQQQKREDSVSLRTSVAGTLFGTDTERVPIPLTLEITAVTNLGSTVGSFTGNRDPNPARGMATFKRVLVPSPVPTVAPA